MKRFGLMVLVVAFGIYIVGCDKKQASLDGVSDGVAATGTTTTASMDNLAAMSATVPASSSSANLSANSSINAPLVDSDSGLTTVASESNLAPLPPSGPYKPTVQEIQTALKNSGYYTGAVDGKAGPLTKKATEEFQKANSIQVDGKVGPKTWGLLERYLETTSAVASLEVPKAKKR